MRIRWYGQSAFLLRGERSGFIDPFGPMGGTRGATGVAAEHDDAAGTPRAIL
jgi:L-ascorbate metabolism protein UlaG (beta-lactamase superfamily)